MIFCEKHELLTKTRILVFGCSSKQLFNFCEHHFLTVCNKKVKHSLLTFATNIISKIALKLLFDPQSYDTIILIFSPTIIAIKVFKITKEFALLMTPLLGATAYPNISLIESALCNFFLLPSFRECQLYPVCNGFEIHFIIKWRLGSLHSTDCQNFIN